MERQTGDPRGTTFLLRGPIIDGADLHVVCRLIGESVRIVTVYRP